MTVIQSFLLGLLQGIAEFLPISSSGHLRIAQELFGLEEVPLLFDVILHLSTLLAVCIFFRKKIILSDEIITSCILEDCVKIPGTEYVIKKLEESEMQELVQFVNSELSIRYGVFAVRTVSYFERILFEVKYHPYLIIILYLIRS